MILEQLPNGDYHITIDALDVDRAVRAYIEATHPELDGDKIGIQSGIISDILVSNLYYAAQQYDNKPNNL